MDDEDYDTIGRHVVEMDYDWFEWDEPRKSMRRALPNWDKIDKIHQDNLVDITMQLKEQYDAVELQEEFSRETGKNAIWGGKETKGFQEWKRGIL